MPESELRASFVYALEDSLRGHSNSVYQKDVCPFAHTHCDGIETVGRK